MNDFAELIRRARSGSDAAIGDLMESMRTYLLLVANQELEPQLRQKVAASDVVQDVCLLVSERFSNFRGTSEGEFRAWLRQILLNSMADSRRKYVLSKKRDAAREVSIANDVLSPASDISPRTSMIAREEAGILMKAMQRLPLDYQEVLRKRNWELTSFEEIGVSMNRSADAAQKLWARAVKQLEQELGDSVE